MRTPIASEVAADDGRVKQVSQELKEKRCGDCREGQSGSQGNSAQNCRVTLKSGIEISGAPECGSGSVRGVEEKDGTGSKGLD